MPPPFQAPPTSPPKRPRPRRPRPRLTDVPETDTKSLADPLSCTTVDLREEEALLLPSSNAQPQPLSLDDPLRVLATLKAHEDPFLSSDALGAKVQGVVEREGRNINRGGVVYLHDVEMLALLNLAVRERVRGLLVRSVGVAKARRRGREGECEFCLKAGLMGAGSDGTKRSGRCTCSRQVRAAQALGMMKIRDWEEEQLRMRKKTDKRCGDDAIEGTKLQKLEASDPEGEKSKTKTADKEGLRRTSTGRNIAGIAKEKTEEVEITAAVQVRRRPFRPERKVGMSDWIKALEDDGRVSKEVVAKAYLHLK